MRPARALATTVILTTACAGPVPAPAPVVVAPPPEPAGIQTAAVTPATQTPVALAPTQDVAAAAPALGLPPKLTAAQVEKTFTHHRRFFDEAYRERLQGKPGLAGALAVSFIVNADGTTRGARVVQSSLNDLPFERAILERIERMNFPPAAGPTPVERYPLQFAATPTP
jgi:TonB family protein